MCITERSTDLICGLRRNCDRGFNGRPVRDCCCEFSGLTAGLGHAGGACTAFFNFSSELFGVSSAGFLFLKALSLSFSVFLGAGIGLDFSRDAGCPDACLRLGLDEVGHCLALVCGLWSCDKHAERFEEGIGLARRIGKQLLDRGGRTARCEGAQMCVITRRFGALRVGIGDDGVCVVVL